ncbi:unnamed protein product [Nippostrongylus brasiliensis]|uniref:BPTI/Kunitz inhibitor domain-containing protein n=1 Tax=Nippostrongylus brasiliensis TaxID=27835 RepID=A0A0N4YY82_NIPBR|nr:unnamed protein product [Nippostrongylus brasiliensis]
MFLLTIAIVVRLVFSSDYGISVHVQRRSPQSATTASDLCQMAVDKGTCSRDLIRYYYDPTVDECKRFSYSGCGGNANRFMRRTNCRSRCVKGTTHKPVPLGEPITGKSEVLTNHIATANIRNCPHCDPLFGICVDGECGCIAGFRKLGKICIGLRFRHQRMRRQDDLSCEFPMREHNGVVPM